MLKARYQRYVLQFKRPSGTSRGVLREKESWFILLQDSERPGLTGIGECGILRTLSYDDKPGYEARLQQLCTEINDTQPDTYDALISALIEWPSIRFGLEMAVADLNHGGQRISYQTSFTQGTPITINGLVWMGEAAFMREQIVQKLEQGFTCIKLKIGAIDFEQELSLLRGIRQEFDANAIEIRVDANGAFAPDQALEKLKRLSEYDLHSIEQPIKAGQWEEMARLCEQTPLPIALDEELIGTHDPATKTSMLDTIAPQYIILKPSLVGGFAATQEWTDRADERNIPWWITSALESNIGLNAIAQYTAQTGNPMPQGLGTGQLYTNNIPSPLEVADGNLHYNTNGSWDLTPLDL